MGHPTLVFYWEAKMSKLSLRQQLFEIGQHETEQFGYELVDMEYKRNQKPQVLTYFVYHPDGVNLDVCADISHAIGKQLDELDLIPNAYQLEVSSPGLDRPIKTLDDYRRNLGKLVEFKLYAAQDGQKDFLGTIKDYDENTVTIIDESGEETTFDQDSIAIMKQAIVF